MEFDNDQPQQLSKLFEEQRSIMSLDMRAMMREELGSIKDKLDRLFVTESKRCNGCEQRHTVA